MGEYKTGGKALRDANASKHQHVLQQCPGYDIKLHPLRELWLGVRMVLPLTLKRPQLRQLLGRHVLMRSFGVDSILGEHKHRIQTSGKGNRKSANASFFMRTKTEEPAVAFNATKDDDDLLEKKSVIFCWLNEINLSLHPGKATANQQTHHFSCGQKLSNLRSHSTRRKMMMIYLKRRVSSFAD